MVGGRGVLGRALRLYVPLAFFLVAMLFPFYWMAITSIKPNRELYSQRVMPLVVHQPTLQHYIDLFEQTNFLTWTYNTMLVAVVTTIISLVLGVMTGYPLARMNFPGRPWWPLASPPPTWFPSRCSSSRWPTSSTRWASATRCPPSC